MPSKLLGIQQELSDITEAYLPQYGSMPCGLTCSGEGLEEEAHREGTLMVEISTDGEEMAYREGHLNKQKFGG